MVKNVFKRLTASVLTVLILITSFTCLSITASAATPVATVPTETEDVTDNDDNDSDIDLNQFGAVITSDDVGFPVSSNDLITKRNLEKYLNNSGMITYSSDSGIALIYEGTRNTITMYETKDTGGNVIKNTALIGHKHSYNTQYRFVMNSKVSGETSYNVYCIQPGVLANSWTVYTKNASSVWNKLSDNQKEAINTALVFGNEGNYSGIKGTGTINTDQCYIATQLIIWEIVVGERSAKVPYALNSGKAGYLNMFCLNGKNPNIKSAYNKIVSAMAKAKAVPSFDSNTITISCTYDRGTNKWTYGATTLTDSNSAISSFKGLEGTYDCGNAKVTATISGNKLVLKAGSGNIDASTKTASKSATKSGTFSTTAGLITYGNTSVQDMVTGGKATPPTSKLSVKVNVKVTGNINCDGRIQKTILTESEKASGVAVDEGALSLPALVSGWYFKVTPPSSFKTYYGVNSFILGPTDKDGFTQSVSDYIEDNLDSNLTHGVPTGTYTYEELGRLQSDGSYKISSVYTNNSASGTLVLKSGSDDALDTVSRVSNVIRIPVYIRKTLEDNPSPRQYNYWCFDLTNNETGIVYKLITNTTGGGVGSCRIISISDGSSPDDYQDIAYDEHHALLYRLWLPEGTYTLHELGKASNASGDSIVDTIYDIAEDIEIVVSTDEYKSIMGNGIETQFADGYDASIGGIEVTIDNKISSYITIEKSDSETGSALSGAIYGIYSDDIIGDDGNILSEVLDEDGMISSMFLLETVKIDGMGHGKTASKYGTGIYYVQEIEAPRGYELSNEIFKVELDPVKGGTVTDGDKETHNTDPGADVVIEAEDNPAKGSFEIYKKSANTSITNGNNKYSLAGAQFTLVSKKSDGESYILTTDVNGYAAVSDIYAGDYLLTEIKASPGYTIDPNCKNVTITIVGNETYTYNCNEPPDTGLLRLYKESADTAMTDGNDCYSLEGAVYNLKHDATGQTWTLTTNSQGVAQIDNLPLGNYTLTETTPSKGYAVDSTIHHIIITSDMLDLSISSLEPPKYDPIGLILSKTDYDGNTRQGNARLDGAIFHFKFYDQADAKGNLICEFDAVTKYVTGDDKNSRLYLTMDYITADSWKSYTGHTLAEYFTDDGDFKAPLGSMIVEETGYPEGYLEGNVISVIGSDNSVTNGILIQNIEDNELNHRIQVVNSVNPMLVQQTNIIRGGVSVEKHDLDDDSTDAQGNANLSASFAIYNKSDNNIYVTVDGVQKTVEPDGLITTITTDSETKIAKTLNDFLPYGTYEIKEVNTDGTYSINAWSRTFSIVSDGQIIEYTSDAAKNPVNRGGVQVVKFDSDKVSANPSGEATLEDAEFTIVNESNSYVYINNKRYEKGEVILTIKTNKAGLATTGSDVLPIGKFRIYESKRPNGYLLNETWSQTFDITAKGEMVSFTTVDDTVQDTPIKGGIKLYKSDADRITSGDIDNADKPQGDASLAGAVFTIVNMSPNSVVVNGREFNKGEIVTTITTDEYGVATTDTDGDGKDYTLPYGTYYVYEHSNPTGYHIDTVFVGIVAIRVDGQVYASNYHTSNPVKEPVYRGGISGQKVDVETKLDEPQGDASLAGAEISIYNESTEFVYVNGKWYAPGEVCLKIYTDADGYFTTDTDGDGKDYTFPYGTYRLVETNNPTGYHVNKNWSVVVKIREDGKVYDVTNEPVGDQVVRGGVQVQKWDKEFNKSEALGGKNHGDNEYGTGLNGITFAITNKSVHSVVVDGKLYKSNEVVKTIMTSWDEEIGAYTAQTDSDTLPYGTYEIKEVATNMSYLLTDGVARTFTIREEGKIVTVDKNNNDLVFKDQVIRGDIEFVKIANGTSARMSVAWVLTNVTTGERHVLVTDRNGEFYSSSDVIPHTSNTNGNDALLSDIDSGATISMSDVDFDAGIYFSLGEDGSVSDANDDLRALPYGKYTLKEVRTDTNEGYQLQEFDFYIYRDDTVVNLGTITDDEVTIRTNAVDDSTGVKIGYADGTVIIVDTVTYENLTKNKSYTAKGTLMDKGTGGPIVYKDDEGNYNPVTAEFEFVPKSTNGTVDVEFVFENADIAGKSVVVFESIHETETGTKIVDHADINDENQTVQYPKIGTSALSGLMNDHDARADKDTVIVDTVSYSNLIPNRSYKLIGTLMDATTGDEALDVNGKEITVTKEFTPKESDGTIDIEFKFDASDLSGHKTVVFESLEYRNNRIALHADLNDENQTIYFPEIKTNAVFEETNSNEGVTSGIAVINDIVSYNSLIPGKTYTVTGTLMNKATGEALLINDKPVTATKGFIPVEPNGTVVITFEFDASGLAGETVVAFEKLSRNDIELAVHTDINDENQTVYFPKITTHAVYGDSEYGEGITGETVEITDTVTYSNLRAGQEYTLVGTLMDKVSGAALERDGEVITSTVTFTPEESDGTVDVKFTFDATGYEGRTFVVYERLVRNDVALAFHEDISDENQTVRFPKIGTELFDSETELNEVAANKMVKLTDIVSYENLTVGRKYVLKGSLINKDTNEPIGVTAQTEFIPDNTSGFVDVVFEIDTTGFENTTLVAFEELYRIDDDTIVAIHKDIDDKGQTVTIPDVKTSAVSKETGNNESFANEFVTIIDTVSYYNLVPGNSYIVTGWLVDTETGEVILDNNGEQIISSVGLMPDASDGNIDMEFVLDATDYVGKDITVYETISRNGVELAVHKDITDDNQTIHFPEIKTSAVYGDVDYNEGLATDEVTITDTVIYKNLRAGEEYTVTGVLISADTGNVLEIVDENTATDDEADPVTVTSSVTFTPEKSNGTVDVEFTFDASSLAGKTIVVFESLSRNNIEVAVHKDITDDKQSIHFPEIKTTLTDKETGLSESMAYDKVVLVDTVDYTNLTVGQKYTMTGILVDKETGEFIVDANGNNITAQTEFVAESIDGTVEVVFEFDGSLLAGKSVVAFESCYRDDKEVAVHVDIEDANQTVNFPRASTVLHKSDSDEKLLYVTNNMVITDTVSYENLTTGNLYKLEGTLMNKETGEPVVDSMDVPITAMTYFTAEDVNGTVDIIYNFNGANLGGQELVAFTRLYAVSADEDQNEVAVLLYVDEDIDNKDETVTVAQPSIGTTAVSKNTGNHMLEYGDTVTIIDTVEYTNLNVGTIYTVTGVLMDKATQKEYVGSENDVTVVTTQFTPEETSGTTEVQFDISTKDIKGHTLVVFETVTLDDVVIATHTDIDDDEQSVYVADIDTNAYGSDKRAKTVDISTEAKVVDIVSYDNLVAGQEYNIEGYVVDSNGNKVGNSVKMTFTPDKSAGKIEMTFTVDTTQYNGQTLTVFEYIYDKTGEVLAVHNDIDDKDQQVVVKTKTVVQTGIENYAGLFAMVAMILAIFGIVAVIGIFYLRKKSVSNMK